MYKHRTLADIFIGNYSDYQGIASILFREEKQDNVIKYVILKSWVKTGVVSMSEGVSETLGLLSGVSYDICKPYINQTTGFSNLLKQKANQTDIKLSTLYVKVIEPLEGYQIINSLLAEERIILSPESKDTVSQALQDYSVGEVNHVVYALFHSVAEREISHISPQARIYGTSRVYW
jgi:hypothetical protein